VGRCDEALAMLDRGLQIDPTRQLLTRMKGHAYFVRRQFPQALEFYLEAIRREPLFPNSPVWAARSYLAMTNYPAAIEEFERHDVLLGRTPAETKQQYAALRQALDEGGARGYWLKQLELTQKLRQSEEYPYEYAQLYARLGDKDQALTFLEKAYEKHDELIYLIFDEFWDPWRDEPRFEAVRQKVGLPRHPNFPRSDVEASRPGSAGIPAGEMDCSNVPARMLGPKHHSLKRVSQVSGSVRLGINEPMTTASSMMP
jgi:tetratricopeptide (TPR) repeat protein